MGNENMAVVMARELVGLNRMLTVGRTIYMSGTPDSDRIGIRTALSGCINFIKQVLPDGVDLVPPLSDLLYALHDLDKGHASSFLKPIPKRGGRHIAISLELFRAMAAALMELYQQAGKSRSEAAAEVAQKLDSLGYHDGKKAISAERVEDWRDKVSEGGNSLGAKRFKSVLTSVRKAHPDDPVAAIGLVFDALPPAVRSLIPTQPASDRNPRDG